MTKPLLALGAVNVDPEGVEILCKVILLLLRLIAKTSNENPVLSTTSRPPAPSNWHPFRLPKMIKGVEEIVLLMDGFVVNNNSSWSMEIKS